MKVPRAKLTLPVALAGQARISSAANYEYEAIELGAPPDAIAVIPTRMNDLGHVVGYATFPNSTHAPAIHRAWRFEGGGYTLIDVLPQYGPAEYSIVGGLVGGYGLTSNNTGYAWRYTDALGTQEIVNISNCSWPTFEYPTTVNDGGVIVGVSCVIQHPDGWIWTADEGLRVLDDLIDPGPPYFLDRPVDINNTGQIVVRGTTFGLTRAFLLTPVSTTSVAGGGEVAVYWTAVLWPSIPTPPAISTTRGSRRASRMPSNSTGGASRTAFTSSGSPAAPLRRRRARRSS